MRLDGCLYLFCIVELAERTVDVLEVIAYEPYVVIAGRLQAVNQ